MVSFNGDPTNAVIMDHLLDVPDCWALEEALRVQVFYTTAYMLLKLEARTERQ